ncbi:hypothetical protein EYF80_017971 [Liparis tanakae]|uniref:Uncharacterized protein n=1 Tax=Liparis tanakae TaxID=230148 RepID=A0A4Z2I1U0_9TELE|nr:hypothetical protein EYF80_017971 [Liparis tanakae]
MHRTAGSGRGEAAGPRSSQSSAHSIALSALQETSALHHQKQSQKPSEETLHCPTDSTHTLALPKCQTEIGIHHTTHSSSGAHTHSLPSMPLLDSEEVKIGVDTGKHP